MHKIILTLSLLIISNVSFSERSKYIDLNAINKLDFEKYSDIGYLEIIPQFEEKPNPEKLMKIEFFHGTYDGSDASIDSLKHVQEILEIDRKSNKNFRTDVIAISNRLSSFKHSPEFHDMMEFSGMSKNNEKVYFQQVPDFMDYNSKLKKQKPDRIPSAKMIEKLKYYEAKMGRKSWTLVRFTTGFMGSYAAIYFTEGITQAVLASVALLPALGSAGIAYHLNRFGKFLTDGKWSKWLLESDKFFARKVRKAFGFNAKTLQESLHTNKDFFEKKFPNLYSKNPELFEDYKQESTHRFKKKKIGKLRSIISKLKAAEEYLKWWVTEVAFVGITIQAPQAIMGISKSYASMGLMNGSTAFMGDLLTSSSLGFLAQGPGDIAIQIRKYQMVSELKDSILDGSKQFENSDALVKEIDKVLAKNGPFKNYIIGDNSHPALVRIENISRKRASIVSFFSLMGVGADLAQVPLSKALLVGVGAGGALYYAKVQGLLKPRKLKENFKKYLSKMRSTKIPLTLKSLRLRRCEAKFQVY